MAEDGNLKTIEERVEAKLADKKRIFAHVIDGVPIIDKEAQQQLRSLLELDIKDAHIGNGQSSVPTSATSPLSFDKGGIDFNPDYLEIQTEGNSVNVSSPLNIEAMKNIEFNGLVPFIFSITPINNLPLLFGVKKDENNLKLSLLKK